MGLGDVYKRQDTSNGRWDNKSPFNSILTQQHLCKKLPKSVNVHLSYSVLHQCRFLRHGVEKQTGCMCSVVTVPKFSFMVSFGRFWGKTTWFRFSCSKLPIARSKDNKQQAGTVGHFSSKQESTLWITSLPTKRMVAIKQLQNS